MAAVIDYLCIRPDHQLPEDAAAPVVVCDAGRGYCPAGGAEGHEWRATGGRTLATVRDWMRRPVTVA